MRVTEVMGRSSVRPAMVTAVAGVGLVGAQVVLGRHGPTWLALPFLTVGLGLLSVTATGPRRTLDAPVVAAGRADGPGHPVLALASVVNCAYAAGAAFHRPATAPTYDITVAWSVGLGLFVAAGCAGRSPRRLVARAVEPVWQVVSGRRRPGWPAVAGGAVTVVALVARVVALDRFPVLFDSDEAFFLLDARLARHGDLPNPYGSSLWGMHRLYMAAQGMVSRPFADTYASYRLLGGLLGVGAVVCTWRAGRRIVGEWAALAGAAVLALLPFHLWASRSALNNSLNALSLALVLLFTMRLLESRRRADAVGLGMALGTALFGYTPAVTFPLVAAAGVVSTVAITRWVRRSRGGGDGRSLRGGTRLIGRLTVWVVGGWFVSAAPLIGYFAGDPDALLGRTRMVARQARSTDLPTRLGWVPEGLLYPATIQPATPAAHFFRHGGPFLGWAVGFLVLVGIGTWAGWLVGAIRGSTPRRRVEVLVAAWMVLGVAVSQSEGMASQRLAGASVLWALAAGSGVVSLVAQAHVLVGPARAVRLQPYLAGMAAVGVVAVGVGGAIHWFDDDRQLVAYGDHRSAAAYDLGYRLERRDPSLGRVLLGSEGAISYTGFGNFRFLAPGLDDVILAVPPFEPGAGSPVGVPVLLPGDVLVVHVERPEAERCAVLARYPDAQVQEARTRGGEPLYTTYRLDGVGLAEGRTTSGSALEPVGVTPCA